MRQRRRLGGLALVNHYLTAREVGVEAERPTVLVGRWGGQENEHSEYDDW